jgi:L-fucose mutarotase
MLKGLCVNPSIVQALALCGHGDRILISDGNFPLDTKCTGRFKIYLGVSKGLPKVTDILASVMSMVNFEKAEVMTPEGAPPEIFTEFRKMLMLDLVEHSRQEFYEESGKDDIKCAISTGDDRLFANIILTIGTV